MSKKTRDLRACAVTLCCVVNTLLQAQPRSLPLSDFRRGHNIAANTGYQNSDWRVEDFAKLPPQKMQSQGISVIGQYAYYINKARKLGYYLGFNIGTGREFHTNWSNSYFFLLPGIVASLVYSFDAKTRCAIGFAGHLERMRLQHKDSELDLKFTATSVGGTFDLDYFFSNNWGVRLNFSRRYLFYESVEDAKSRQLVEGADIKNTANSYNIGLVYHWR